MHRAAIRSLRIVEGKIREPGPETKSTSYKEIEKRSSDTISQTTSIASHQKRKSDRKGRRMQEV
jgi:hypothetical protein